MTEQITKHVISFIFLKPLKLCFFARFVFFLLERYVFEFGWTLNKKETCNGLTTENYIYFIILYVKGKGSDLTFMQKQNGQF